MYFNASLGGPQQGGANYPTDYVGQMIRGPKEIYISDPQFALILAKTFAPGYGMLPAGTVMAKNSSAAGNTSKLVPYVATPVDTTKTDTAKVYVSSDVANTATTVNIPLAYSYRFIVGDDLILGSYVTSAAVYHNGGAISAIDRTTTPGIATITFTTAVAVATFTVANATHVYCEAGTTGKYCKAVYILDQDIDTGTNEYATDALASVVISNALLNSNLLINHDSAAITDLGTVVDGTVVILK